MNRQTKSERHTPREAERLRDKEMGVNRSGRRGCGEAARGTKPDGERLIHTDKKGRKEKELER